MNNIPIREATIRNLNPMQIVRELRWVASSLEQGRMEHVSGGIIVNSDAENNVYIDSNLVVKWKYED